MVKLIHSTVDGDSVIGYLARVSNPKALPSDDAAKLIRYLIKHNHWSPFEMASMCVEINTTRDISAQILRHRSFSFQEFSQRYAEVPPAEIPYFRTQDTENRQNSKDELEPYKQQELQWKAAKMMVQVHSLYQDLLEEGVAKECARKILPMCSPTKLYMHGTVRSWIHYINLRSANGTQKEHQEIATECGRLLRQCFPFTAAASLDK